MTTRLVDCGRIDLSALVSCVTFCVMAGCSERSIPFDDGIYVVDPGRGVTNRCELGMTVSEIGLFFVDSSTHGLFDDAWTWKRYTASRFLLVPSLGAIGVVEADKRISHLEFHVEAYTNPAVPGLVVQNPFHGRLGDKLDFSKGQVTRSDVQAALGRLEHGSTNSAEFAALGKAGKLFWLATTGDFEELWYEDLGLSFTLRTNRVVSFTTSRPKKPTNN